MTTDPTRGTAHPVAGVVAPRGLVVPAYFHPAVAGGDWRRLAAAGRGVTAIVLNSEDGPGPAPERELTAVAVATGRPTYGYVDTDYGRRSINDIRRDVVRWRDWYPTAGIFLDRAPAGASMLPRFEQLVAGIRRIGARTVILNHGTHPHPGYAMVGDAMVTFEGPYAAHRSLEVPGWTRILPAARFWHLVYDVPARLMGDALDRAAAANVGAVLVTDRAGANPWDGLPSYFPAQVAAWAG